jgi:integrase
MTLRVYAAPLRPMLVNEIATDDVLSVLKPVWNNKPETASRLRGRIERVLDAAKAQGLRSGENPARWRGHLNQLLPKRPWLTRSHHAAMSYGDVPSFVCNLQSYPGITAPALEFIILTAVRAGEALGAHWEEFDLERAVWTVPALRTKIGRDHRVPLSRPVLRIIKAMQEVRSGDFVFPGRKLGKHLTVRRPLALLRQMNVEDATVHGFRSSFRDWVAECTHYSNEVAEMALAHAVEDKTEAAYRRGDLFEKRRKLMDAWASYCTTPTSAKVIALRH